MQMLITKYATKGRKSFQLINGISYYSFFIFKILNIQYKNKIVVENIEL